VIPIDEEHSADPDTLEAQYADLTSAKRGKMHASVERFRPAGTSKCFACLYDLSGVLGSNDSRTICPECGETVSRAINTMRWALRATRAVWHRRIALWTGVFLGGWAWTEVFIILRFQRALSVNDIRMTDAMRLVAAVLPLLVFYNAARWLHERNPTISILRLVLGSTGILFWNAAAFALMLWLLQVMIEFLYQV